MDLRQRDLRKTLAMGAVLFALALAPYLQTARFDSVNYDDPNYLSAPSRVGEGLSPGSILWGLTTFHFNWHPLTWMSLMLDVSLFGQSAGAMHLDSAFIHAINGVLFFALLMRLFRSAWPAFLVAGVFAVHPLRVEAVAWISARKDVLSSFFWLLTLLSYFEYSHRKLTGQSASRFYVLTLISLSLGLMSKGMLVTLPLTLLLLDAWPLRRIESIRFRSVWPVVAEKIPMFVIAAGGVVMTILGQRLAGGFLQDRLTLSARLGNAIIAIQSYLQTTVWPTNLAVFYPHPSLLPAGGWPASQLAAAATITLGLTILAFATLRRWPWLAVGWCWFLVTLLPVLGLVQIGEQSRADRYTYVPTIGLGLAVVGMMVHRAPKWQGVLIAFGFVLIAVFESITWRQVGYWRNSETLMRHAATVVPSNYVAHAKLGEIAYDRGDFGLAESELFQALQIKPDDADSLGNLAMIELVSNRQDQAEVHFRSAVSRKPTISICNNFGNLLLQSKRFSEAIDQYEIAIRLGSTYPQTFNNLATARFSLGQAEHALEIWKQLIQEHPDYVPGIVRYADALIFAGRVVEGLDLLNRSSQAQPGNAQLMTALAWQLSTVADPRLQDPARSLRLAGRACDMTHFDEPLALDALAAAQARSGDFEKAIQTATQAGELAVKKGNMSLATEIRERAARYGNHQPYIAPSTAPSK